MTKYEAAHDSLSVNKISVNVTISQETFNSCHDKKWPSDGLLQICRQLFESDHENQSYSMKVMYSLATVKHKRNKTLLQQSINISTVIKDIFLVYIIITHSNYLHFHKKYSIH